MRVCPKCGFSDDPLWRHDFFKRDLVYMHKDDFKNNYPELYAKLEREKYVIEGQFVYHKSKNYVRRKEPANINQPFDENYETIPTARGHCSDWGNRRIREKKAQTKLLEVIR